MEWVNQSSAVVRHSVDGEVSARQVLINTLSKLHIVRMSPVCVASVNSKCRDLILPSNAHVNCYCPMLQPSVDCLYTTTMH